ncbi:MAG: hypothetical protein GC157_10305 [Frankiales bacterium]|nr:hypothetical protein [Frankiales bacterium]
MSTVAHAAAPTVATARLSGGRRAVWWVLVVATVLGMALSVPASGGLQDPSLLLPLLGYFAMGALVAHRRPHNPIGWVFLGVAVVASAVGTSNAAVQAGLDQQAAALAADPSGAGIAWPRWVVLAALAGGSLWFLLLYLMTFLTFLLFPDGLPSRRWRPLLWTGTVAVALVVVGSATAATVTIDASADGPSVVIANPWAPPWVDALRPLEQPVGAVGAGVALLGLGAAACAPFVRARRGTAMERAQLRWFGFAAAILVVFFFVGDWLPGGNSGLAAQLGFTVAAAFVPTACGVAVLRYRLYDIDRIISRTAAYTVVTAVVVGVYALVVTSASALLPDGSSSWVVAAATLAAAGLVRPLHSRVRRVVDRRFNREKVDAQRAVDAFGARLADDVDPDHARAQLLGVVTRLFAPAASSLWTTDR